MTYKVHGAGVATTHYANKRQAIAACRRIASDARTIAHVGIVREDGFTHPIYSASRLQPRLLGWAVSCPCGCN